MSLLRQQLRRHVPAPLRMRLNPPPTWTVHALSATSPLDLEAATATPVLDEADLARHGLTLAADPFGLHADGLWHVFVEILHQGERLARIGLATSADGTRWDYRGTVVAEPFHLSYPFVFEAEGERWLVPESYADESVRLYRASDFPTQWVHDSTLLTGRPFKDASPFRHEGRWWMLVETSHHQHDELRLYGAPQLHGPWTEHPASPVVTADAAFSRPAGRPFVERGRLYRLAQDCSGRYGRAVHAVEIIELTTATYRERRLLRPVIGPDASGWNAGAAHHVDAHPQPSGWLCFVDGHR